MLDPHREIQALVDGFVADLSELAKRIAIEQLKVAFGAGVKLAAKPAGGARASTAPTPVRAPAGRPPAGRARRAPRELDDLRGKLLTVISDNPGRRAEDLNAALGTKTPQIAQLLRRLIAEQLVRTEGARRGTRYFAVAPADAPNGRRGGDAAAAAHRAERAPAPAAEEPAS